MGAQRSAVRVIELVSSQVKFEIRNSKFEILPVRFVLNGLGVSGKVKALVDLAVLLDRRFQPAIWCLDERGVMAVEAEEAGVPVELLGRKPRLDPALMLRMARRLRDERVAVVHAINPPAMLYAGVASRLAGVPAIVGALSAFACLTSETAGDMGGERQALTSATLSNRMRNRVAARLVHRTVVVSDGLGQAFARFNGIRRDRFTTVGYAVDVQAFAPRSRSADRDRIRRQLGAGPEDCLIGTVAQLIPRKDLGTLLKAFVRLTADHPAALLAIAGDGPLRAELEARVEDLGIAGRVRLLGHRRDVPGLLAALDVFALSSAFEPFGLVVLEAMAAGLPILATEVGEMPTILGHGKRGLLVPPGDPAALAHAMARLLDDRDFARGLAAAGGEYVREHHSIERMVNSYERLYDELLSY